jgi:hypothetical protein
VLLQQFQAGNRHQQLTQALSVYSQPFVDVLDLPFPLQLVSDNGGQESECVLCKCLDLVVDTCYELPTVVVSANKLRIDDDS